MVRAHYIMSRETVAPTSDIIAPIVIADAPSSPAHTGTPSALYALSAPHSIRAARVSICINQARTRHSQPSYQVLTLLWPSSSRTCSFLPGQQHARDLQLDPVFTAMTRAHQHHNSVPSAPSHLVVGLSVPLLGHTPWSRVHPWPSALRLGIVITLPRPPEHRLRPVSTFTNTTTRSPLLPTPRGHSPLSPSPRGLLCTSSIRSLRFDFSYIMSSSRAHLDVSRINPPKRLSFVF